MTMKSAAFTVSALCLAACLTACTSVGQVPTAKLATGTLYSANGAPAGTVRVFAAGEEVTINVTAIGLPKGAHGVHLHAAGACAAPSFASAGAHLNPRGMQHGSANPAGSHLGDLPNLPVDAYGAGTVTARLNGTRALVEAALFDADGTALVIHADRDDYLTDPSGNSGTRIACAVLNR